MFLNVLTQAIPSPFFEGLWRHEQDRTATGYRTLGYWTGLARTLEAAGVDALFLADIHGTFQVYSGSHGPAVRYAVQSPGIDPTLLVPAMAAVTSRLGFAVTYSTTFHEPYQAARIFSTLDHLTGGRIGWNIVTSDLRVARGTGLAEPLSHDERYERADEFVDIAVRLWEDSWADGAVVADPANDMFADPARVLAVTRQTRYFDVDVAHQSEPSPQRTPVLYQAGASPRGRAFAARHAEVAFVALSSFQQGRTEVDLLRAEAAVHGRELRVLQGSALLVAETERAARALADDYLRLASREGLTTKWCGWAGVDLAAYPDDTPISSIPQENLHSVRKFLAEVASGRELTVADLREHVAVPRRPNRFARMMLYGTAEQVADRMQEWVERTGIDGFNLTPLPTTTGLANLCELLMPELRRRGLAGEPAGTTLRERYFGPGHRYRRAG